MNKWICASASCLLGFGCSSDDGASTQAVPGGDFLVHVAVDNPEGRLNYFAPFESLDTPEFDADKALELGGGARLYLAPGIGSFMIGDGEEPSLTRYDVNAQGDFVAGTKLSFGAYGVTRMAFNAIVFVDSNKAYYRDNTQLQIITFDPTEMVVLESRTIEGAAREGFSPGFGTSVARPEALYFPIGYSNDDGAVLGGSVIVRVDPSTDEISLVTDERCAALNASLTTPAGDTYFFSSENNTNAWRGYGLEKGVHDCAVRIRANESTIDPDWFLDLTTRTNGYAAVGAVPAGGSKIWVNVLDEAAADLPNPIGDAIWELPFFQWYLLDVESAAPAVRNDDRPLSSIVSGGIVIDGRAFIGEYRDETESAIVEMTADGFVERGKVPGYLFGMGRIR